MKKIGIAIIVILIIGSFFGYRSMTGKVVNEELDNFAQCLTDKEIKMYGTEWCPHCKDQKKLFGDSFEYVDYIDCDKQREVCQNEGIQGYPTWNINGKSYPGTQSLEGLSNLSECEL